MKVIQINPNITAFYYGADSVGNQNPSSGSENDWVYGACISLGVASYAIHNGDSCLVFDTLCSPEQAGEIKIYLEQLGMVKFSVVNSHWHLHHIGGNALYKGCNIIGTRKTRRELVEQKDLIEAGISSWGPPAIEAVYPPDIVFDSELSVFLGDLEVCLKAVNIHSADSLCAYIPRYKVLLAGDMVEDTIPYITNPEALDTHLRNYALLKEMDIAAILPNHCRLAPLEKGGYSKEIIASSAYYLGELLRLLEADPDAEPLELRSFMAEYLDRGVVAYWPPYERVHRNNAEKLRAYLKSGKEADA